MVYLIAGLLLWAAVHFIPSLAPGLKQRWKGSLGYGGYMGSFSLLLLGATALIIFGWQNSSVSHLYSFNFDVRPYVALLVYIGFVLMVASYLPTRIKRWIRHPQLTGLLFWGVAHLLINGDSRSVILFGALSVWAVTEMFLINRREGTAVECAVASWAIEFVAPVIAAVIFLTAYYFHAYLSGVPIRL